MVRDVSIPTERLQRYGDFVRRNSRDGVYDPLLGLEALLSCLTPDTKPLVLYGMTDGEMYFTSSQIYNDVLNVLEGIGVERRAFPVTSKAVWSYCESFDRNGEITDGSLVDIGAVVKETVVRTPEGLDFSYHISQAGIELARPLGFNAIEFVHKARNSRIEHRYDSMLKILGGVQSTTGKRRPLAVFHILKFLVENPGYHQNKDIQEALYGKIHDGVISSILKYCGRAGIIDYESLCKETGGKKGRGFVTYVLADKNMLEAVEAETYEKVKKLRPLFYQREGLSRITGFIRNNPKISYETYDISRKLGLSRQHISNCLSLLSDIGILKPESGYNGKKTRSKGRANDLTKMLYDNVFLPGEELAFTLNPKSIEKRTVNPEYVRGYLINYQEERIYKGPQEEREVRSAILDVLDEKSKKLSQIVEEGNRILSRERKDAAFYRQLLILKADGLVETVERGYYRKLPQAD